jgi:chemotaxis protein MotB
MMLLKKVESPTETSPGKLADYITVSSQERGLVISLKDTLLFASGSDQLNPEARKIIKQLGNSLLAIPNHIRVEGHTDNLPIKNARIPSNWELSTLRATTVLHVLQGEVGIPPERLSVSGYGEYRPLASNDTPENRAKNRRVDIVILKQKYAQF